MFKLTGAKQFAATLIFWYVSGALRPWATFGLCASQAGVWMCQQDGIQFIAAVSSNLFRIRYHCQAFNYFNLAGADEFAVDFYSA